MFKLIKTLKKLAEKVEKLDKRVEELEKKQSQKTISQRTLEENEAVTTSQIIDEWLNGEDGE